jgi:hypothetical protein
MDATIEKSLMAGRVYQSTTGIINWLPDIESLGWSTIVSRRLASGFEATVFKKGAEIVVSIAGTGSGADWGRMREASLVYRQINSDRQQNSTYRSKQPILPEQRSALLGIVSAEAWLP